RLCGLRNFFVSLGPTDPVAAWGRRPRRARRGVNSCTNASPLTPPSSHSNSTALPAHRPSGFSPGKNAAPGTSIRSPSSVRSAPRSFVSLNQSIVPRPRVAATLAKAIDDASASQVIRGQLDPHAVAVHLPDAIPLHPSAQVAEGLVAVVELNSEHPAAKGFHALPFELDLLVCFAHPPPVPRVAAAATTAAADCIGYATGVTFVASG